jgi:hypothetical protein
LAGAGIRGSVDGVIALGASGGQLVAMVVRPGMAPLVGGVVAGLLGSMMASRLIASQLFGVAANDPMNPITPYGGNVCCTGNAVSGGAFDQRKMEAVPTFWSTRRSL